MLKDLGGLEIFGFCIEIVFRVSAEDVWLGLFF